MQIGRLLPWVAGAVVAYLIFKPAPVPDAPGLRGVMVNISGSTLSVKTGMGGFPIAVEASLPTSYDAQIQQAWTQSGTSNNPSYLTNMINTLHDAGYPIAAKSLTNLLTQGYLAAHSSNVT